MKTNGSVNFDPFAIVHFAIIYWFLSEPCFDAEIDCGTMNAKKTKTAATIGKLTANRSGANELRAIDNTSDYSLFRYTTKIPRFLQ